ncbi:MAG: hypothetical protein CMG63_04600 [Candidatus Marinimicrobia bacterium]|nr:hypothetical protein [Candidatus Neomarinimicrobiota bacterium]
MSSSNKIKKFILDNLSNHQKDIIQTAISKFGVSRQAVHKHMKSLINDNKVLAHGVTRGRYYELVPTVNFSKSFNIDQFSSDLEIIKKHIIPNFKSLSKNIYEILEFSASVLISNVIEHSGATKIYCKIYINHDNAHFVVSDNGVGVFGKIAQKLKLNDVKLATLELAKGRLANDPEDLACAELNAVVRSFDEAKIESSKIALSYRSNDQKWKINNSVQKYGSRIHLIINPLSKKTCSETLFQVFNNENKHVRIPLNLLQISNVRVMNSSNYVLNALRNVKGYKKVEFDFQNINLIGPTFANALIINTLKDNHSAEINWINSNETIDLLMARAVNRQS